MTSIQSAVPDNVEGKPVDIEKSKDWQSIEQARQSFTMACNILRRPGNWQHLPNFKGATFEVHKSTAPAGPVDIVEKGDYISIDIPGPGPKSGGGKDWVEVEYLEENFDPGVDESFGLRVRASISPINGEAQDTPAHFFKDTATSTFIIRRKNKTVTAAYYGRNEIANIKGAGFLDSMRNAVVATGALIGVSEIQWTLLLEGLLRTEET